jgi:aspartate kinase
MNTLVLKFGGTSVASPQHLLGVARRILEEKQRGRRILVVVSAMGQTTDELAELARQVSPHPPRREMDMLLTAGERISMALLAMALESLGERAMSFTGSQSGIITDDRHSDARIVEIRPFRIEETVEHDTVAIVAGFQGVSSRKEITTLGRGGSDTTAVALAIRFGCPWCEIYTDVHGVLTADPRIVPGARTIPHIDYEPTIVLSHLGAQVLFRRAVILARKFAMPLRVRCSLSDGPDTWIGPPPKEVEMNTQPERAGGPMESDRILSVAMEARCVAVELEGKANAQALLAILDEGPAAVPWTWCEVQVMADGVRVRAMRPEPGPDEQQLRDRCRGTKAVVRVCRGLAVVSLIGEGILARPELLGEAMAVLEKAGIELKSCRTASLAVSFVIDGPKAPDAVRLLHERFIEGT